MKIFTNTAISLDGKINTSQNKQLFLGSKEDLRLMGVLRGHADAVLVGGNTFRNWPIPSPPSPGLGRKKPIWNVIVSHKMNFKLSERYLADKRIRPLFLTDKKTLPKTFPCEVVQLAGKITPSWIVKQLTKRGIKNLLIEGGGNLIFQFFAADLINEVYLTVTPRIIGESKAPGFVTGNGFAGHQLKHLNLRASRQVGNEVFLRYSVVKHG
jgi:riboflavin-specific deaminase-like protein